MKKLIILIGFAFVYWFLIRKSEPEAKAVAGSPGGSFSALLPTSKTITTSPTTQQPVTSTTSGSTTSGSTSTGTTSTSSTSTSSDAEPPPSKPQVQPAFTFNTPKSSFV